MLSVFFVHDVVLRVWVYYSMGCHVSVLLRAGGTCDYILLYTMICNVPAKSQCNGHFNIT